MTIKQRPILLLILMFLSILPYFIFAKIPRFDFIDSDVIKIYASTLASFIGLIGASLLWWQFVLGIRPLSSAWIIDLIWVNGIHKKIGIYGSLFIFLHPLLQLYSFGFDYLYGTIIPNLNDKVQVSITLGKFAFAILLFIWITSAILRGKISFRTWKFLHFLAYLIFPFVFLHAKDFGVFLTGSDLLSIYWMFLILTYILFIFTRIFFQFGYGKKLYIVREVNKLTADTNEYVLASKKHKGIIPKKGQFVYLQTKAMGENHPFTVSKYDEDKELITITTKKLGKFTIGLENLTIGSEVLLDGPYGVFTKEAYVTDRRVVMIVGGIGITPFVRLIQSVNTLKKMPFLFNANKTQADLVYMDLIKENLKTNYINIYSNCKPEEVNGEECEFGFFRIDLIKKYIGDDLNLNDYFLCGPPIMMKLVTKDLLKAGVKKNQIFSEKFSI